MEPRWHPPQPLLLLIMIATSSALALGETCCADCLEQTDPLHTVITYDPLVFDQCSAATGICCYGCFFTHGTLEYQEGITFDSNGSAQGSAGQPFSFAFNEVSRVTYDFLKINQAQTSFVTNKSTEASSTGNIFTICVDEPGTVVFRGWGTDSCTQVTEEYKFSVVEVNSTGTCGSSGSITLVGSASSAHNELVDGTGRDTTSSLYTGQEDFTNCNPTRGTVVTQADGSKVCKCTGDWRNPPTCDEFSYVKVVITILGAVATVVSILISVRAYVKSRKSSKAKSSTNKDAEEDSNDDCDDILSVEVIHIGNKLPVGTPGKPSPGIPGSPARPSFIANEQITTATKETTL